MQSPLANAQPDTLFVCGRLLSRGQSITVAESALAPKDLALVAKGKLVKRKAAKPGHVQIVFPPKKG